MHLVSISDVHIKNKDDHSYNLFMSFLNDEKTVEAEVILLLGDIFDLAVGGAEKQYKAFSELFDLLVERAKTSKIIFLEGNHDFHLTRLFDFLNQRTVIRIDCLTKSTILDYKGQKIMLSHGDDIEIGNEGYMKYKRFITNKLIYFLSNYIVPYEIVQLIGNYSSSKSRENNIKYYGSDSFQEKLKEKFRESFKKAFGQSDFDVLLCGHSHIQDLYEAEGKVYANNGYIRTSKNFIVIENSKVSFCPITI